MFVEAAVDFRCPTRVMDPSSTVLRKGQVNGSRKSSISSIQLHKLSVRTKPDKDAPKGVFTLPAELLRKIVEYLAEGADKIPKLDDRGYLSQQSFRAPDPPTEEQLKDISNFRLTCQLFSHIGAQRQHAKVRVKFNKNSFERLRGIASVDYLASNVRRFCYMLPIGFYHNKGKSPPPFSRSVPVYILTP